MYVPYNLMYFIVILILLFIVIGLFFEISVNSLIMFYGLYNLVSWWYSVFLIYIVVVIFHTELAWVLNYESIISTNGVLYRTIGAGVGLILVFFCGFCFRSLQFTRLTLSYTITFAAGLLSIFFYLIVIDFFSLYIVLEFQTMLLYILYNMDATYSSVHIRSGIRFFILSLFTSLMLLMGIIFIYLGTGTLVFEEITYFYNHGFFYELGHNLVYGVFFFKLGLFPYYIWMLDIFCYTDTIMFVYYIIIAKIPLFGIFITLVSQMGPNFMLLFLSIISIVIGLTCSYFESDFRRFIIFSSLVQFGMFNVALCGSNYFILHGVCYTYFNYILIFIFIFCLVTLLYSGENKQSVYMIYNFSVVGCVYFWLGLGMSMCILSVIGVPPFTGFVGKLYLFYGLAVDGLLSYLFLLILTSIMASVYYFNIIRSLLFTKLENNLHYVGHLGLLHYCQTFVVVVAGSSLFFVIDICEYWW